MCVQGGWDKRRGEQAGELTRGNRRNDPSVRPDHQFADLKAKPRVSVSAYHRAGRHFWEAQISPSGKMKSQTREKEGGRGVHVYDLLRVEAESKQRHSPHGLLLQSKLANVKTNLIAIWQKRARQEKEEEGYQKVRTKSDKGLTLLTDFTQAPRCGQNSRVHSD